MRSDEERLADILEAIERIQRHVSDKSRAGFDHDELLQSAVLHWIEIIARPPEDSQTRSATQTRESPGGRSSPCATG